MSLLNCSVMLLFCNLCPCSWNCTTKQESLAPKSSKMYYKAASARDFVDYRNRRREQLMWEQWGIFCASSGRLLGWRRVEDGGGLWRWRMGWEDLATEAGNHGPSYVPEDIFWGYLDFGTLALFPECSSLIEIIEDNKTCHRHSVFRS